MILSNRILSHSRAGTVASLLAEECTFHELTNLTVRLHHNTEYTHHDKLEERRGLAASSAHRDRCKDNAYYSRFRPFVVSLTGAVPESSFGAIKEIAKEAARVTKPRLEW